MFSPPSLINVKVEQCEKRVRTLSGRFAVVGGQLLENTGLMPALACIQSVWRARTANAVRILYTVQNE